MSTWIVSSLERLGATWHGSGSLGGCLHVLWSQVWKLPCYCWIGPYAWFLFVCFFNIWLHCAARGILVPWLGIEPPSPPMEEGVLTSGPPGNSLHKVLIFQITFKKRLDQVNFHQQYLWVFVSLPPRLSFRYSKISKDKNYLVILFCISLLVKMTIFSHSGVISILPFEWYSVTFILYQNYLVSI